MASSAIGLGKKRGEPAAQGLERARSQGGKCHGAAPHLLEQVRDGITVDFPEGGVVGHVAASLFWGSSKGKERRELQAPTEMWGLPCIHSNLNLSPPPLSRLEDRKFSV